MCKCVCGLDVKFVVVDACLLAIVDKESEVMTLSLSAFGEFEEALAFP